MTAEGLGAPRATYRLQLGPDLDFHAAADLVAYLAALGVTHVYCSPVLQARAGSTHGYDVADPTRLSDALGGEEGFRRLADRARAHGLGLVVDLVPNHVGIGPDNPLWEELLAEGPSARAARFFDVDWSPALPGAEGKVLLPVLGTTYGEALAGGELELEVGARGPRVRYHEHTLPLSPPSREALARAEDPAGLAGLPGRPETWSRLHGLLEAQHYRLVHWRIGDAVVNYRRFFAVDELAAVRVEDPQVFAHTHARVLELVRSGAVDGLRLDHIDGLSDPAGYLARLRSEVGAATWILVEKILGPAEHLPPWPVAGTTGYEFLADVLGLFVDPSAERALTEVAVAFDAWPAADDPSPGLGDAAARAKREVLEHDLAADGERLVDGFWALTQRHLGIRDVTRGACRAALYATLVALDVYRVYTRVGEDPAAADAARISRAVAEARTGAPGVPAFLWGFLERFLCGQEGDSPLHAEALRRFHQVASAAMAKGVEDTLLYRQHRLVALNEVGVEPDRFGSSVEAFHAANARRAHHHPETLLTTSTHDTKRGEDVRLRVAALSEVSGRWRDLTHRWRERHDALRTELASGLRVPDPATEYLCYQTLIGVWPPGGAPDLADLVERVSAYLVKAAREDGRVTRWTDPDEAFEGGLVAFVERLLDPERSADFLHELSSIARTTGDIAITSSLAQVLLRVTSPGAPDTYQGMELWGDNLVDPDNRRPIDFGRRRELLEGLDADAVDLDRLVAERADGRIKLWVLSRALRARRSHPGCFGPAGGYVPLSVEGRFGGHVVAFARVAPDGTAALTVAPRLVGAVRGDRDGVPTGAAWADTRLVLPEELAGHAWVDVLGGPLGRGAPASAVGDEGSAALALAGVLVALPVALLAGAPASPVR